MHSYAALTATHFSQFNQRISAALAPGCGGAADDSRRRAIGQCSTHQRLSKLSLSFCEAGNSKGSMRTAHFLQAATAASRTAAALPRAQAAFPRLQHARSMAVKAAGEQDSHANWQSCALQQRLRCAKQGLCPNIAMLQ